MKITKIKNNANIYNHFMSIYEPLEKLYRSKIHFGVAGGSISNIFFFNKLKDKQDLDLYFEDTKDFQRASDILGKINNSVVNSKFARTFVINERKVQLIKKTGTPEEILDSFDMSCCRIMISGNKIFNKASKDLKIRKIHADISSRILKYHYRGFRITNQAKEVLKNLFYEDKKYPSYYDDDEVLSKQIFVNLLHESQHLYGNVPDFIREVLESIGTHYKLIKIFEEDFFTTDIYEDINYAARIARCRKDGKYRDEVLQRNPEFLI